MNLGVIGIGLMGGSFILAGKRGEEKRIIRTIGYDSNSAASEMALSLNIIDAIATSPLQVAEESDVILLAVPVSATEHVLSSILPALEKDPSKLVMDLGSTKQDVIASAKRALGDGILLQCFVPSHPIAGRECAGVENALADLFDGKRIFLTPELPLPLQPSEHLRKARTIWGSIGIGCEVLEMTPQQHDAAFAAVSHLPHLTAFATILAIHQQPLGETYLPLGGSGFRDCTRVAASNPTMWRDIFLSNRNEVLLQSRLLRDQLLRLEALVEAENGEALHDELETASKLRASWS